MNNFAPPPDNSIPQWNKATYKEILVGYHQILASSDSVAKQNNAQQDKYINNNDNIAVVDAVKNDEVQKDSMIPDVSKTRSNPLVKNGHNEGTNDEKFTLTGMRSCFSAQQKSNCSKRNIKKALTKPRPFIQHKTISNPKSLVRNDKFLKQKRSIDKAFSKSSYTKKQLKCISTIADLSYCQNCLLYQHSNSRDLNDSEHMAALHSKDASSQTITSIFSDPETSDIEDYPIHQNQENDEFVIEMIRFENRSLDSSHELIDNPRSNAEIHYSDSDTDSELEIFIDPYASKIDERLIHIRLNIFGIFIRGVLILKLGNL